MDVLLLLLNLKALYSTDRKDFCSDMFFKNCFSVFVSNSFTYVQNFRRILMQLFEIINLYYIIMPMVYSNLILIFLLNKSNSLTMQVVDFGLV